MRWRTWVAILKVELERIGNLRSQGDRYAPYIEDVPYVMYFHEGYGLRGVIWHGNFGHPMSHGCVSLPTSEAERLFDWVGVGTLVSVHE